ncbi:YncE family protein [Lunatibacter salilacus]|uniref:YncE family protein n=1 Tax=Lunatibacter salilacus TaxID=2483804 RepID=UPI00131DC028|nr:surface layer protein [Lunatibacter salilacus]
MKSIKFYQYLFVSFLLVTTLSCISDPIEIPLGEYEGGVLIINEGAFGANDGEVYHYDREGHGITSNVFERVNSRPFAGVIQHLAHHESYFYLVANTGKVEIVNDADFVSVGAITSDQLVIPRAIAVAGQKLFISDYGPYDDQWNNPDSFIAVVEGKEGGGVSKTIPVPSQPEGLFVVGDRLLVACTGGKEVVVVDTQTEEVVTNLPLPEGSPYSFFNYNGKLYLYARSATHVYFYQLNPSSFAITDVIDIPVANSIYNGNFALGENGNVYIIQTGGSTDKIVVVSLSTREILDDNLYQGSNFYGVGYDSSTKNLYIGDNAGWQSNGEVLVVNEEGSLQRTLEVGKGPSGFLFR